MSSRYSCKNCPDWDEFRDTDNKPLPGPIDGSTLGSCKADLPGAYEVTINGQKYHTSFPVTGSYDWCRPGRMNMQMRDTPPEPPQAPPQKKYDTFE